MSTDQKTPTAGVRPDTRVARAADAGYVRRLAALAVRGLPTMYLPQRPGFAQTVRRVPNAPGGVRAEGENLRYAAIAALGLAQVDETTQRDVLAGRTAAELATSVAERGVTAADLGAAALTGWAAAEITGSIPATLLGRLIGAARASEPEPTVDFAWTLTALVAVRDAVALADGTESDVADAAARAAARLRTAQGGSGVFPHALPAETLGRYRAHVGCFADQVYPIQALARYYAATGDRHALDAADRCAERIVALQGPAGQWWWHYDVRTGGVVEGYPVYSVHQHAMGPMALFDLCEAGGRDQRAAIDAGLAWLRDHPETASELVDEGNGVVWRKVGRREPRKALRSLRAVTTALHPALRLGLLDRAFPPGPVDHECRPYELGWLLYAWLSVPRPGDAS